MLPGTIRMERIDSGDKLKGAADNEAMIALMNSCSDAGEVMKTSKSYKNRMSIVKSGF